MKPKTKKLLVNYAKMLGVSLAIALVAALLIFLFAFFTNSMSWMAGLEWVRRILYIIGSLLLVVGAVGMLFSGNEYRNSKIGFADDETFADFHSRTGISWYAALIIIAVAVLVVATLDDFLFLGLIGLY